jgi:hypothetical protein
MADRIPFRFEGTFFETLGIRIVEASRERVVARWKSGPR